MVMVVTGIVSSKTHAKSNFVMIKLPNRISIDIPRNWKAMTKDQLITLDTVVESQIDLSNLPKKNSDLVFAAAYTDDVGDKAKVMFRYYPDMKVTQSEVGQASPEEIKKFDNTTKQSIIGALKASGHTILHWGGTQKQVLAGRTALVTEYRRPPSSGERGSFSVRLIGILDGPKSFTLTISYNELYATIFKPICD